MKKIIYLYFIVSSFATFSLAQTTITWTGANLNSNWHDTGNWDLGVVPDSLDIAIISNSADSMPYLTDSAHVRRLLLQAGTFLTVDTSAQLRITNLTGDGLSCRGRLLNHGHMNIIANDRGIAPTGGVGEIKNYGHLTAFTVNQAAIQYHNLNNFHTGDIIASSANGSGIIITNELTNRGLIQIDSAASIGLLTSGANHLNTCTGQINVRNCQVGMRVEGQFSNLSEIIISDVSIGIIHNQIGGMGTFQNGDDRYIFIDKAADTAIIADRVENLGYIDINGQGGSIGIYVGNGQVFESPMGGQINLNGEFESSLIVEQNGIFFTNQFSEREYIDDMLDWDYNRNEYNRVIDSSYRNFLIHVPEIYDSTSAVPLLFMFHGSSGTGTKFYNISGWKETADTANFISVYPTARKYYLPEDNNCSTKWSSNGLPPQIIPGEHIQDDVPFVRELIELCKNTFNIDTSRIYVCGFSNGGSFVRTRLYDEMATELSATASSGGFGIPYIQDTPDSVYLPHYDLIGSLDDRALSSNGVSPEFPYTADSLLAIATVRTKIYNQAATCQVDTTYTEDSHLPDYNIIQFQNDLSGQGNEYNLCMVPGLGHSFANGTNHPVRYTEILWSWFLQWTR